MTALVAGCALLLAYLPPVARLFGFVPMAPITVTAMLAITAAYVVANEWAKRAFGARAHF
ncbi:MAG: hypothetical protein ACXW16_02620 [Burkholderiaceae bacterium]